MQGRLVPGLLGTVTQGWDTQRVTRGFSKHGAVLQQGKLTGGHEGLQAQLRGWKQGQSSPHSTKAIFEFLLFLNGSSPRTASTRIKPSAAAQPCTAAPHL